MTLIQTIDNLKKNPACLDQGSNSDNFFISDEESRDPNTIESGSSLPPSETPFKLPAKRHFNDGRTSRMLSWKFCDIQG